MAGRRSSGAGALGCPGSEGHRCQCGAVKAVAGGLPLLGGAGVGVCGVFPP